MTVRRVGTVVTPTGLGGGDHLCWGYTDRAEYRGAVLAYLTDGLQRGDRLWYVADGPVAALRDDLAGLPGRDRLLDVGGLLITPAAEAFGDPGTFELDPGLQAYLDAVEAALRDGYTGLRLSVDVTMLAAGGHADRLPGYELAADRLLARRAMSTLCGYDERRTAGFDVISSVHPLQPTERAVPFSLHWDGATDRGFCLAGEVDLAWGEQFRGALGAAATASPGDLVLDLARLRFIDAAATRVLAQVALAEQVAGRGVVLRSPRRTVALCLAAFDLAGLVAP